jgi:hypothetical protein
MDGKEVKSVLRCDGPNRIIHEQTEIKTNKTNRAIREVAGDKMTLVI